MQVDLLSLTNQDKKLTMVDTEQLLRNHIASLFAELVAGSVDRKKAERLIEDLRMAQRKLSVRPDEVDDRFALCPRAIDAVVKYLTERGSPASEEDIIAALLAGGFRGGKRENARVIHSSISIFLRGTGASTQKIREVNGKIGLHEWPDAMFGQEG